MRADTGRKSAVAWRAGSYNNAAAQYSRARLSLADRQQSVNNHAPIIAIAAKQIVAASDFQQKLWETNAFRVDLLNIAVLFERGFGSFPESDELLW